MVMKMKFPYIIGSDLSGVVVAVGSSVKRLAVGDEVYTDRGADKQGAYAEYVAVPEQQVSLKPKSLSHAEAAAVPLVALTSYQALTRQSNIQPGQKVLVLGGSGGAGSFGVMLAKALGASEVAATCSSKNAEYVKSIGADRVIPYDQKQWGNELAGADYDIIYDTVGGAESYEHSKKVLKKGGVFTTIAGDKQGRDSDGKLDLKTAASVGAAVVGRKLASFVGSPSYQYFMLDANSDKTRHELDHITKFIEEGKVKPNIQQTYEFKDVIGMWQESAGGRVRGKLTMHFNPSQSQQQQ